MNREKGKYRRNVRWYYVSLFLAELIFTIPIWVSFYQRYFDLGQLSVIMGIMVVVGMVMEVPTGMVADMMGRKWSVVIGSLITATGIGLIGTANGGSQIIAGLVLDAIGGAFISGANTALLYDSLKASGDEDKLQKVQARGVAVDQVAIILSGFAGGYLYMANFRFPYLLMALTTALAGLTYLLMYEPKNRGEKFSLKSYKDNLVNGVGQLFKNKKTIRMTVFYVFQSNLRHQYRF